MDSSDAEVLGWVGLGTSQDPTADWSFGYAVLPTHRANGYATEALKAALTYCSKQPRSQTLWGECHRANNASAHVMLGAGMQELPHAPKGTSRFRFPPQPTN